MNNKTYLEDYTGPIPYGYESSLEGFLGHLEQELKKCNCKCHD